MDDDDREVVFAREAPQETEQPGDVCRAVLVHRVEAHERVEHQYPRLEASNHLL